MSYDVYLNELNGDICKVEKHSEGGTFVLGGTTDAHLNITWNYVGYFCEHIDKQQGIRWLYNKKAKDCIQRLEEAVKKLGTERDDDYWAPTAGNAGYALSILLGWAKENPKGVFGGD